MGGHLVDHRAIDLAIGPEGDGSAVRDDSDANHSTGVRGVVGQPVPPFPMPGVKLHLGGGNGNRFELE